MLIITRWLYSLQLLYNGLSEYIELCTLNFRANALYTHHRDINEQCVYIAENSVILEW